MIICPRIVNKRKETQTLIVLPKQLRIKIAIVTTKTILIFQMVVGYVVNAKITIFVVE